MSKWISVEDKLPEKSGKYIVFFMRYGTEPRVEQTGFSAIKEDNCFTFEQMVSKGHGKKEWTNVKRDDVTHWMPLPEPPKTGET